MANKPRVYKIQVQPGSSGTVTVPVKNPLTSQELRSVTIAIQKAYALGREDRDKSRQEAYETGIAIGQARASKQSEPDPENADFFGL